MTQVVERHTRGNRTYVVFEPAGDRSHNGQAEHRPYVRASDAERQAWVDQRVADAKARALANKRAERKPERKPEPAPEPAEPPARCDDCGYLIGSRGHQIQCLNMRVFLPRRPRTGGNGMRPMSD